MTFWESLYGFWPHFTITAILSALISCVASAHAILNKRDTRGVIGWVGVIWLTPLIGTLLYVLLGINRIHRKARMLRGAHERLPPVTAFACSKATLRNVLGTDNGHLEALATMVGAATKRPLLSGNKVVPLVNGDQVYPAMLAAIDGARESVALSTYIFNDDSAGQQFVEALGRAIARGVAVRVLIDDIGARYKWPSVIPALQKVHVPVGRFLPALLSVWFAYSNLRSHRKLLIADGRIGFTGGMNIREGSRAGEGGAFSIQDLHCRFDGPVVSQLQSVFVDDWEFATQEILAGPLWFPELEPQGEVLARGVSDGPDEDLDKLRMTLLGALTCAQRSIKILTPYFLPDEPLISALNIAAMRGVEVDIVLPSQNNLQMVQWASNALLWQVLGNGCRVWFSAPPFDHTKLMIVDDIWTFVGSGNWDPRSLRLNFEFNVECYDQDLAHCLGTLVAAKMQGAKQITLAEVDSKPLPIKLRDGIARLMSPYL